MLTSATSKNATTCSLKKYITLLCIKRVLVFFKAWRRFDSTVVKKIKLTARKLQNIFSLLRGVNSFLPHCSIVKVLQYILWLEVDMFSHSFFIWILPPQPLILKVANCWKVHWPVLILIQPGEKIPHYYRKNLIYKSRAVNFLFLTTVYPCREITDGNQAIKMLIITQLTQLDIVDSNWEPGDLWSSLRLFQPLGGYGCSWIHWGLLQKETEELYIMRSHVDPDATEDCQPGMGLFLWEMGLFLVDHMRD